MLEHSQVKQKSAFFSELSDEFILGLGAELNKIKFKSETNFVVPQPSPEAQWWPKSPGQMVLPLYIKFPIRCFIFPLTLPDTAVRSREQFSKHKNKISSLDAESSNREVINDLADEELLYINSIIASEFVKRVTTCFGNAITPIALSNRPITTLEVDLLEIPNCVFVYSPKTARGRWQKFTKKHCPKIAKRIVAALSESKIGIDRELVNLHGHPRLEAKIEETGQFSDILTSLQTLIDEQKFKIILSEVRAFNDEFTSDHFTSAALRLGRILEYCIYILAESWEVEISRTSLKMIADLQKSLDFLKDQLVLFVHANPAEKEIERTKVEKQVHNHQRKISELIFSLDRDPEDSGPNVPLNISSILRDAKKQFAKNQNVRTQLEELISGPSIRNLLELRNRCAHANTELKHQEIDHQDIEAMGRNLRYVIFVLCNITDTIYRQKLV